MRSRIASGVPGRARVVSRTYLAVTLGLALVACGRTAQPPPPSRLERIDAAIARGAAFLLSRQGADGAIRSPVYPFFKDGYSLTPLALAALLTVREDARVAPAYRRGVDFIATLVGPDGRLRDDVDGPRYILYSTALGALVLNATGNERHRGARDALVAALRERQLPDGGWAYDESKLSNLSATVYALGALSLARVPAGDPVFVRARAFVDRCQADDGGFFFSPELPDANKAGPGRSYGSMTADGVRALLRLGAAPDHPKVVAAAAWLERRFDPAANPGDFPDVALVRRDSSYFYWTWTAAHALRALGKGKGRADALANTLLERQQPDGSWRNQATEMREDDPVVATSFAVAALAVCRSMLTETYVSHGAR